MKRKPRRQLQQQRVADAPYSSLTGHGGERLAAEVYYYTNCSTAAEFSAWWEANDAKIRALRQLQKLPSVLRSVLDAMEVPNV